MKPILTLALVAFLFLQTTGLAAFVAPLPCADGCPEDGPDGSCSPTCYECVCCPALRSCAQPGFTVRSPSVSCPTRQADAGVAPADAAPTDIFHVPRTSLA